VSDDPRGALDDVADEATQDDFALRHVPFEACFNFRDVGGYETRDGKRVRWARLYRAGGLQSMTPADIERCCGLGVATVIDLRRPDEVAAWPSAWLDERGIRHLPAPLLPSGSSERLDERFGRGVSSGRYIGYLEYAGPRLAQALEWLAQPETYPAVVHCAAGKDRTGVLVAIVLDLLGVDHETVVADYALTNRDVDRVHRWLVANGLIPADDPRSDLLAPVEAIEAFLAHLLEEHGSVEAYVRSLGVAGETLEGLREQLLEPAERGRGIAGGAPGEVG
jgi:protein-tyrosine phosphatase